MDLTRWLLRRAAGRPHVFVLSTPGGTAARLAVEAEVRRRGWPTADGPADADLLVVCGWLDRSSRELSETVWQAIPSPRARCTVTDATGVDAALSAAQRELADAGRQRADVVQRHAADSVGESRQAIPEPEMAERASDRDGLKLDVLHLPLGPVLPDWPAGLVVQARLQGDVIEQASVEVFRGAASPRQPFWSQPWRAAAAGESVTQGAAARRRAGAHLDSLARLLGVAGWPDAAMAARRLRDAALGSTPAGVLVAETKAFATRVSRSRTLRWLTDGIGVLTADDAHAAGVTGPALRAAGDVTARWQQWLHEAATACRRVEDEAALASEEMDGPRGRIDGEQPPSAALLSALPTLLSGSELAGARLIVASLDPDLDELAARPATAAHDVATRG